MAHDAQLRIDLDDTTPVIRQIVDQMRTLMVEGHLTVGTFLPSIRRLALDLGVHFATVAEAYRELAEEGWIQISHGRGAVVLPRLVPAENPESSQQFRQKLRNLLAEARSQGVGTATLVRELESVLEGIRS